MSSSTAIIALDRGRTRDRIRTRGKRRGFPYENVLMFTIALGFYIAIATYLVFHLHYMIDDAYARIDNAFDVLFTSDPHLAAIGFFWPPLPSFLELPIIAFKDVWPPLVTQGFAGSIESAIFGAGTVILFNSGLKWAGVARGMRWVLCVVWLINPMTILYFTQGMSEGMFIFFFAASILVFLRWSESGRGVLLPLMGILVGLDCLCRNEAFVLALVMGVAVMVMAARRRGGWREIETTALLFGLPAFLVVMLWFGTAAIIEHDPLYVLHANGFSFAAAATNNGAPAAANYNDQVYGAVTFTSLRDGAAYVFGHSILLFPAVIPLLMLLVPRFLLKKHRIPVVILIVFGLCIPVADILRLRTGLGPYLRYQIAVIPFTFILAVYVLRSLRAKIPVASSWVALGITGILGLSTVLSANTLSNPAIAQQEAPALAAVTANKSVPELTGEKNAIDLGGILTPQVLALATDHGRILCDSTLCFPIILNAPDAKQFLVTSDRNFQAALAQPKIYNVEYFLVASPGGRGQEDALNKAYPGLWEDGAGFSSLVGQVEGGLYRLYRITGDTGRG